MRHFLTLLVLVASGSGFAQGLINFYNTPNTLISDSNGGVSHPIAPPVQNYSFVLLTSPVGADTFSFAGVYATNTLIPGMINGGSGVAVPGWAAGTARDFVVFGWASAGGGGIIYKTSWLNPDLSLGSIYPSVFDFGVSDIATGIAGGVTGSGTVPTLNLFGGPTGIQSGFPLGSPLPEPSSFALIGLGSAALLIRYRRKQTTG